MVYFRKASMYQVAQDEDDRGTNRICSEARFSCRVLSYISGLLNASSLLLRRKLGGKQALEHLKVPEVQNTYSVLSRSFWSQKKSSFSLGSLYIIRQQPSFSKISTQECGRSGEEWRKGRQERRMRTRKKGEQQYSGK